VPLITALDLAIRPAVDGESTSTARRKARISFQCEPATFHQRRHNSRLDQVRSSNSSPLKRARGDQMRLYVSLIRSYSA